jgi:hypothetical protein
VLELPLTAATVSGEPGMESALEEESFQSRALTVGMHYYKARALQWVVVLHFMESETGVGAFLSTERQQQTVA